MKKWTEEKKHATSSALNWNLEEKDSDEDVGFDYGTGAKSAEPSPEHTE